MPCCALCNQPMPQGHGNRKYCPTCQGNKAREHGRRKKAACSCCGKPVHKTRPRDGWTPPAKHLCRECRTAKPKRKRTSFKRATCSNCGAPAYGARCRQCRDKAQRSESFNASRAEKKAKLSQRRSARDRSAPGPFRQGERRRLLIKWKAQGRICVYCQAKPVEQVDHVIPLALGGTNFEGNLAPSCADCNRLKMDNLLSAWRYGVSIRKWRTAVTVAPKLKRAVQPELFTLHTCVGCGCAFSGRKRKYCGDSCMWEWNARRARERRRASVGLPPTWDVPTRPTRRAA